MATPILVGSPVASVYTNPLSGAVGSGAVVVVAGCRSQGAGPMATFTATYGGEAMTSVSQVSNGSDTRRIAVFGKTTPLTGTQSLAITTTDTVRGHGFASYSTVDTATPFGTPATVSATSTTPAVTVTATANDVVLVLLTWGTTATLDTPGGTVRFSHSEDSHNVRLIEVAGDTTVNWSGVFSASTAYVAIGVALKGTAAAAAADQRSSTRGVGRGLTRGFAG